MQKVWIVIGLLAALILIVYSMNFYFVSFLNANQNEVGDTSYGTATTKAAYFHQLKKRVRALKPIYLNRNPQYYRIRNKVWRNFEPKPYENVSTVWDLSYWVRMLFNWNAFDFLLLCFALNHSIRIEYGSIYFVKILKIFCD